MSAAAVTAQAGGQPLLAPARGWPWDQAHMHFGPPAAPLGRAIAALPGEPTKRIARLTFEILRPVPVGRVEVAARVVRSGGRIELTDAVLTDGDGGAVPARGVRRARARRCVDADAGPTGRRRAGRAR